MAERAQHHGELARKVVLEALEQSARLVDHLQRVRPDVAFGMPLRVLGRGGQRHELGRDRLQHSPLARERETEGRPPRLQEQLLDLAEDAVGGQLAERHRRAEPGGRLVDLELEARGELQRAQRPQRVVAESRRVDRSQPPRVEVGLATPRVDELARGRIEEHRVDREIPAPRRFVDREGRIARHADAAVAWSDLGVAARQRDVERARDSFDARELVDAERLADGVDSAGRSEHGLEPFRRQAEHLDVPVLERKPQQRVADGAPDDIRPSAGLLERGEQLSEPGGHFDPHRGRG